MEIIDLLRHRYIRTGELIHLYDIGEAAPRLRYVKVDGWGAYAAVRCGEYEVIRRDCIRRNEHGDWVYRYQE